MANKKGIHVFVSSRDKSTTVTRGNKLSSDCILDFKKQNVYSQKSQDEIHKEILERYKKTKGYDDSFLEEIQKRIDPSIYRALEAYDKQTRITNKRDRYVDIMLKSYRIKSGETPEEYELRSATNKQELLKINNIEIDYDAGGLFGTRAVSKYAKSYEGKAKPSISGPTSAVRHLHFSRLGKKGDLDLTTSTKKMITPELQEILDNLKEEPKGVFGFMNKKPSKEKIVVDGAPKGLMQRFKEFKDKHKKAFKRALIGGLAIITVATACNLKSCSRDVTQTPIATETTYESSETADDNNITIYSEDETEQEEITAESETKEITKEDIDIPNSQGTNNNSEQNESGTQVSEGTETPSIQESEESETQNQEGQEETESQKQSEASVEQNGVENDTPSETETGENKNQTSQEQEGETQNQEETENETQAVEGVEIAEVNADVLSQTEVLKYMLCYSGIGFDTEFQIQNGTYYETPEGEGASGSYTKYANSNVKITKIDILKDGIYLEQYTAEDGSFQDILEQYKDDEAITFSLHFETTDGKIAGWDNSESTQALIINQYVSSLNLSSEVKQNILDAISGNKNITMSDINNIIQQFNQQELEIEL